MMGYTLSNVCWTATFDKANKSTRYWLPNGTGIIKLWVLYCSYSRSFGDRDFVDVVGLTREVVPVGRFSAPTGCVCHSLVGAGVIQVIPHEVCFTSKARSVLVPYWGTSAYVDAVLSDVRAGANRRYMPKLLGLQSHVVKLPYGPICGANYRVAAFLWGPMWPLSQSSAGVIYPFIHNLWTTNGGGVSACG